MVAVKQYRVISDGVECGELVVETGELIPDSMKQPKRKLDWLLSIGAVELVTDGAEPPPAAPPTPPAAPPVNDGGGDG